MLNESDTLESDPKLPVLKSNPAFQKTAQISSNVGVRISDHVHYRRLSAVFLRRGEA
jgi:hypothetical protein